MNILARCAPLLLIPLLLASHRLQAESCCRLSVPEVRFQANSTVPVEGHLDLRCVSRRMNADSVLSDIALLLHENPTVTMCLVGHADNDERDVETLSLQRARRMACELVSVFGIERGRLTAEGQGTRQPRIEERWLRRMSRNERVHGRQANRRVEFQVMSFDWIQPHPGEIAAVRFLSDPAPPSTSAHAFCDAPLACVDLLEAPDTMTVVETQHTTLIVVEEIAVVSADDSTVQFAALAPMIAPNPIVNGELTVVWLPLATQALSFQVMSMVGRTIIELGSVDVAQGERLRIAVPPALPSDAYILRINARTRHWSLRFVKP